MSRLRFLQIDRLYPAYLRQFYTAHQNLRDAPSQIQQAALANDHADAVHRIAFQLEELGYDAHWLPGNAVSLQARWLVESGSFARAMTRPALGEADMVDVVRQRIDEAAPDILYITDTQVFGSAMVRQLRRRPSLVVGFHASYVSPDLDLSAFDLILSPLDGLRDAATRIHGAKASAFFMPGFPRRLFDRAEPVARVHDVFFSGQCTASQHPRRNRLLATVAAHAEHAGYDYHFCLSGDISILPSPLHDNCRPPVYGNAMLQGLRSARIAFDARGEITLGQPGLAGTIDLAGRQTANMRIFEATGCGAMLLTEPFDNLPEFFRAGYEVETYGSEEELIDKITYYTNHPEERDAIAKRGQERCLKDHSLEQRAIGFDQLMRAALDGRFPKASGHQ